MQSQLINQDSKPTANFLELAGEARNKIYTHLFTSAGGYHAILNSPPNFPLPRNRRYTTTRRNANDLAILRTSKQIHHEAAYVFSTAARLRVLQEFAALNADFHGDFSWAHRPYLLLPLWRQLVPVPLALTLHRMAALTLDISIPTMFYARARDALVAALALIGPDHPVTNWIAILSSVAREMMEKLLPALPPSLNKLTFRLQALVPGIERGERLDLQREAVHPFDVSVLRGWAFRAHPVVIACGNLEYRFDRVDRSCVEVIEEEQGGFGLFFSLRASVDSWRGWMDPSRPA